MELLILLILFILLCLYESSTHYKTVRFPTADGVNEVEFDGHSFKLIIKDEEAFLAKLNKEREEILKNLNKINKYTRIIQIENENIALDKLNDMSEIKRRVLAESLPVIEGEEYD